VNLPNHFARSQAFIVSTIAALVLLYPATAWSQEATMATVNGQDEYQVSGRTECGGEATSTIKPGERFIAHELSDGDKDWEVYLKSGVSGTIPRNRIRLLPDEPLMKLNYDECKKEWHKWQFETGTTGEQASAAREHGINYYKILSEASEGDVKAMATFFSFSRFMDGGAAESYCPDTWVLLHVVGDETFAKFLRAQPPQERHGIGVTFSSPGDTEPISAPKPYIKRHFPKTYKLLFAP
jgi:hypothetical protein